MSPVLILMILFIPSIIMLFTAFRTWDELVKFEYENHREVWVTDGKPRGMFWSAPDAGFLQGDFARNFMMFRLVFKTPAWAGQSPTSLKLLKRYRFSVIYWNVSLPIIFGLLIYFHS